MSTDHIQKMSYDSFFCPRCDREFAVSEKISSAQLLKTVIAHVSLAHPDYDPEWHDTYPDHL